MIDLITSSDLYIVEVLHALRTPELVAFFPLMTTLGDIIMIGVLTFGITITLWRKHALAYAAGLWIAVVGSICASSVLKMLAARARPPEAFAAIIETSFSFPSRHTAASVAVYGFLIFTLLHLLPPSPRRSLYVSALSILIVLIGFSRIYLGVHYPSDVLAGFAIGGLFVWFGIWVTKQLKN